MRKSDVIVQLSSIEDNRERAQKSDEAHLNLIECFHVHSV